MMGQASKSYILQMIEAEATDTEYVCGKQNYRNRRGKPLTDYMTIISLISNTKTDKELEIRAVSDDNVYEKGRKISDKESDKVSIYRYKFHGDWNYKILPNK